MPRHLRFAAIITAVFLFSSAFSNHSRNSVSGEGVASGNIPFAIHTGADNAISQIRYGNVTAPVKSVAVSPNGKMATIYFTYREAILGITVIDGKKKNPDQISDPFPVDDQQLNSVVRRFSYNTVTSGAIHLK
jgi:hypothetical protein